MFNRSTLSDRTLMVIAMTTTTGFVAGAAVAQEQTAQTGAFLEEIVVTSRKVTESLQDVPLAISAFTAQSLERSNVEQFDDLTSRVPSLEFHEFNVGLPRYFIRGIGSGSRSGASDPAVGVFLDEVYVGRASGTSGDFMDVERIEVLRGPQGTLFGRNVVGGAVALFSKRPVHELEWSAGTNVGNHERFDVEGMLNAPLTDTIAARFAVSRKTYGGHSFNTLSRHHLDDQDRLAARASFLFEPSEDLDVVLRAEYGRDDARGQWWDLAVEGPFSIGKGNPDPRRGDNPDDGFNRRNDWNVSATVNWDTGVGTLTSISSYRDTSYDARENTTSLVVLPLSDPNRANEHHTLFIQQQNQDAEQYSQELRLSGKPADSLQLVGGLFFLHEEVDRPSFTDYRFIRFNSEGRGGWNAHSETDSFAVFGQAQYSFTERWQLTAGARWTQDRREVAVATFGQHFSGFRDRGVRVAGWTAAGKDDWSEVTPMASLSFKPSDTLHFFATVSRGFKSGGFEDSSPERESIVDPFNPEYAWDYELGFKSELFDRRLRLNANVFYVDYTDLQVGLIRQPDPNLPPFGVVGNAGSAEVSGVEVEWEFAITPDLSFYGSYAYNDNEVRDIVVDGRDISGNRLAYAPENKVSAGVSYSLPTAIGTWTIRGDYSYQDEQFSEINNSDVTRIEGYGLADASFGWTSTSQRLQVELWGKNLGDELYWTAASEVPLRDGYVKYGAPRTYGLSATYRY